MANFTYIPFRDNNGELMVDDTGETILFYVESDLRFTSTPVTTAAQGEVYVYNVFGMDSLPDTVLSITSDDLPSWLVLTDTGDGSAILTGLALPNLNSTYDVTLKLSDGYLEVIQEFTIAVVLAEDDGDTSPSYNDLGESVILIFINGDEGI